MEHRSKRRETAMEHRKSRLVKKGEQSELPPPPPPPSVLDHVIEMAKKDAIFYYEGKSISSDKAIEIVKNNNSINISSKGSNSKQPTVYLTTKGISIED
jgi:hypothetical protein